MINLDNNLDDSVMNSKHHNETAAMNMVSINCNFIYGLYTYT